MAGSFGVLIKYDKASHAPLQLLLEKGVCFYILMDAFAGMAANNMATMHAVVFNYILSYILSPVHKIVQKGGKTKPSSLNFHYIFPYLWQKRYICHFCLTYA